MFGSSRLPGVGRPKPSIPSGACHNLALVALDNNDTLAEDLELVAAALEGLDLDEGRPALVDLVATRDRLARAIRTYLIPRFRDRETPLTVVFAGPTGSGKSTLVNSLTGTDLVDTGPLRPTTRHPVVLASARNGTRYEEISGVACEVIVGVAPILADVAIVDTPDIDSTSLGNRVAAETLLDNADIVVFVTSALRYADLVPWEILRRAVSRGAPVINVLNRLSADSSAVTTAFRSMVSTAGLEPDIIRVPEHHIAPNRHRVPSIAIRELQKRILALVADAGSTRREVLERVMRSTTRETIALADALEAALVQAEVDLDTSHTRFSGAAERLDLGSLCDGIVPGDPPRGRLARTAWRVRNRVSRARWMESRDRMSGRLSSLVEEDLRRLLVQSAVEPSTAVGLIEQGRAMTASAARSWLDEIREMAGPSLIGGALTALAIVDASARNSAIAALESQSEASAIAAARPSLVNRLESIYEMAGEWVAGSIASLPFEEADIRRLRQVTSSLAARSQFADA